MGSELYGNPIAVETSFEWCLKICTADFGWTALLQSGATLVVSGSSIEGTNLFERNFLKTLLDLFGTYFAFKIKLDEFENRANFALVRSYWEIFNDFAINTSWGHWCLTEGLDCPCRSFVVLNLNWSQSESLGVRCDWPFSSNLFHSVGCLSG